MDFDIKTPRVWKSKKFFSVDRGRISPLCKRGIGWYHRWKGSPGYLGLNKSGFYHYFGDLEGFCLRTCLSCIKKRLASFYRKSPIIKKLDPDYLHLLIKYREMVMFQVQLTRNPSNNFFYAASEMVDQKVEPAVRQLWCDYLEIPDNSDLGIRYYAIVRDMFYTRISFSKS